MPFTLDNKLVVAISSRALFDFEEENRVFESGEAAAYMALQLERLETAAAAGVALPLVKKLLAFNADGEHRVEVVILSRNDPVSGLRVFHSAGAHGLKLERGVFTQGREPYRYLGPLKANLFLSANTDDVRAALDAGFPAAHVYPDSVRAAEHPDEIRIAFDGDAVLFSDEAERVFQADGLPAFHAHEAALSREPLAAGPFKAFLEALHRLQSAESPMKIRTALVTARSAPAHERAIRTLMDWHIQIDEAMFLGGLEKGPFLAALGPDFFFDDQAGHCRSAALAGPTGQVLVGIANG
ncbi:5'-nucleotidase [Jeongeupia chitinilytica]|uniref:5'-nucleotidase n=1 Tax=Jeongeupia chitinilytica TaxID=1041641 RepID=A0ABQ3H2W0_9NEIS|nr:5'-nucleotidase [Jeongeupia chitinilytica]GHD67523.1 5'-nucleotidase [Jeongeupia chitinilytica]